MPAVTTTTHREREGEAATSLVVVMVKPSSSSAPQVALGALVSVVGICFAMLLCLGLSKTFRNKRKPTKFPRAHASSPSASTFSSKPAPQAASRASTSDVGVSVDAAGAGAKRLSFGPWGVAGGPGNIQKYNKNNNGNGHQQQLQHRRSNSSTGSVVYGNGNDGKGGGFSWEANPRLIIEAGENGWEAFHMTLASCPAACPPHSRRFCAGFGEGDGAEIEISWEIVADADDYSQRLRLIPGAPKRPPPSPPPQGPPRAWSLQAALPLPGPALEPQAFPANAYFEITIVEPTPLHAEIPVEPPPPPRPPPPAAPFPLSHITATSSAMPHENQSSISNGVPLSSGMVDLEAGVSQYQNDSNKTLEKSPSIYDKVPDMKVMSVGLAANKGSLSLQPGLEPGSVGLHSSGFVFLNGMAHLEGDSKYHRLLAQNRGWSTINTVIGCGFDPANKFVLFTMNGEMVYSLTCKTEEFQYPMFPTVAANYDVSVRINFGQSHFEYAPANRQRVTDPCFRNQNIPGGQRLTGNFYEDSGDLFSIGKIDSQWLGNPVYSSELFEIPIDGRK